jgi:type IV pilus assembly protein PilN
MSEDDKDNINIDNKEEETKSDENQSQGESSPPDTQPTESSGEDQKETQPKVDEKNEHEVIHKKDGRLHIYIRQDKYKGELKSKNWVGRLYIDGKQKISSSGTPNLEEAIPILEKWFDDIHANKGKEEQAPQETVEATSEQPSTAPVVETPKQTEPIAAKSVVTPLENKETSEVKTSSNILEKFKNIKFKKPSFGKKDSAPKITASGKSNFKQKIENLLKAKLGKKTAQGEEIVGVELSNKEIRLAQISTNKANQWVLDKFFIHPVDLPEDASVLDNADKMSEELFLALQKSKIVTSNAAIAIPVTSAIIRVVTAPLMKDEELQKAIDTNSLWENLVQLTDNLDDYSIFHQVINRNDKENTMDILFVASKLSDINSYTSIIKNSGLNAVIIDVKCFALKSAVDQINLISKSSEDANLTAVLEFGLDENYLMILYDNNPIITDIFLRSQDRKILLKSQDQEEKEALVRRFITQVKQAVQDFETKYERRIRNIKVVSNLPNVEDFLSSFRKNLVNTGFNLFDPIDGLKIPQQLEQSINLPNRSYLSTVIGLAFRKLDVFGYYKFVTAVKNINLLPNRAGMIKKKKMKAFSNFAFTGVVGGVIGIYAILFALSFWNIHSYNKKLVDYNNVLSTHAATINEKAKVGKKLGVIATTLKLSKSLKSNKEISYRILAQVASSVPKRVRFDSVEYNGTDQVTIQGIAASDQDILKLIENLSKQKLIKQASLSSMKLPGGQGAQKGFKIFVKVKGI